MPTIKNKSKLTRERIVIENIEPQLQGGDFFIKRITGELVNVTADVLGDGHDVLQAEICYKAANAETWQTVRLSALVNDAYSGTFRVEEQGFYDYKIQNIWFDF